jgi:hypothetical protein
MRARQYARELSPAETRRCAIRYDRIARDVAAAAAAAAVSPRLADNRARARLRSSYLSAPRTHPRNHHRVALVAHRVEHPGGGQRPMKRHAVAGQAATDIATLAAPRSVGPNVECLVVRAGVRPQMLQSLQLLPRRGSPTSCCCCRRPLRSGRGLGLCGPTGCFVLAFGRRRRRRAPGWRAGDACEQAATPLIKLRGHCRACWTTPHVLDEAALDPHVLHVDDMAVGEAPANRRHAGPQLWQAARLESQQAGGLPGRFRP